MTAKQLKELKENLWSPAVKLQVDSDLKLSEFTTLVVHARIKHLINLAANCWLSAFCMDCKLSTAYCRLH